jgi:hypothetical protein
MAINKTKLSDEKEENFQNPIYHINNKKTL